MKATIPVVTRLQDNGDGGYTMYVYNDEDELIANHPNFETYDPNAEPKFGHREPTPQERADILDEDDPYRNGYIGHDEIELELDFDHPFDDPNNAQIPSVRLAKPLSFHAGQ